MRNIISGTTITHLIRLQRGEDAFPNILEYCRKNNIKAATLGIIGACSQVQLAFYSLESKEYENQNFDKDLEVLAVQGNIASLDGELMIHAHGSFSERGCMAVRGGHINSMTVSATLEVTINAFDGEISREYDEDTGLNLLCGQ